MAKKGNLYICNRCGFPIDRGNDTDCVEVKMFEERNIASRERIPVGDPGRLFHKVDAASMLHFCGRCNAALMSCFVYGYEFKN